MVKDVLHFKHELKKIFEENGWNENEGAPWDYIDYTLQLEDGYCRILFRIRSLEDMFPMIDVSLEYGKHQKTKEGMPYTIRDSKIVSVKNDPDLSPKEFYNVLYKTCIRLIRS